MHPGGIYFLDGALSVRLLWGAWKNSSTFGLTTKDRAILQAAADSHRLPLGTYIRMVAIKAAELDREAA